MSAPQAPPYDELKDRSFSFYPPIANIEHNEWRLEQATWSEMMVRNTKTDLDLAIPRRFFGQVSHVEEPVMIVGLNKQLEYKAGGVWPVERKIYSMPGPVLPPPRPAPPSPEAAAAPRGLNAISGSSSYGNESRIGLLIAKVMGAVTLCALVVWAVIALTPDAKPTFVGQDQSYLELTHQDDYFAVVRKLGNPGADRWKPNAGEIQYRALTYKDRNFVVILMGTDKESARYIGTMTAPDRDRVWHPLHYVEFNRGANTASMLRALPVF